MIQRNRRPNTGGQRPLQDVDKGNLEPRKQKPVVRRFIKDISKKKERKTERQKKKKKEGRKRERREEESGAGRKDVFDQIERTFVIPRKLENK